MVGVATGEVIYEPGNPLEKTKIILDAGFPLVDYCVKFCPVTEREKQKSIDGKTPEQIVENRAFCHSSKLIPATNGMRHAQKHQVTHKSEVMSSMEKTVRRPIHKLVFEISATPTV